MVRTGLGLPPVLCRLGNGLHLQGGYYNLICFVPHHRNSKERLVKGFASNHKKRLTRHVRLAFDDCFNAIKFPSFSRVYKTKQNIRIAITDG